MSKRMMMGMGMIKECEQSTDILFINSNYMTRNKPHLSPILTSRHVINLT